MTLRLCHHQQYNPTKPVWWVLSKPFQLPSNHRQLAGPETRPPHSHTWGSLHPHRWAQHSPRQWTPPAAVAKDIRSRFPTKKGKNQRFLSRKSLQMPTNTFPMVLSADPFILTLKPPHRGSTCQSLGHVTNLRAWGRPRRPSSWRRGLHRAGVSPAGRSLSQDVGDRPWRPALPPPSVAQMVT